MKKFIPLMIFLLTISVFASVETTNNYVCPVEGVECSLGDNSFRLERGQELIFEDQSIILFENPAIINGDPIAKFSVNNQELNILETLKRSTSGVVITFDKYNTPQDGIQTKPSVEFTICL